MFNCAEQQFSEYIMAIK